METCQVAVGTGQSLEHSMEVPLKGRCYKRRQVPQMDIPVLLTASPVLAVALVLAGH